MVVAQKFRQQLIDQSLESKGATSVYIFPHEVNKAGVGDEGMRYQNLVYS